MPAELFLRIFSDCCIFFALLGCCPSLLPYSFPLPAAALICAGAAALSAFLSNKGKSLFGQICAVLPLGAALLVNDRQELLILVVPVLYTAVVILQGGIYQEYFAYRKFFIRSLILLGIVWGIISVANYLEDPTGLKEQLVFPEVILQYALTHFLCGVILQRQLRLGARSQGGAEQIAGMLSSVGAATFGFILTQPLLQQGSVDLLRKIASILVIPFTVLMDVLVYLFKKMSQEMYESPEYQEAVESSGQGSMAPPTDYQEMMAELTKDQTAEHSPWIMIVAAAAVVIILLLTFYAFTKLRGHSGGILVLAEVTEKGKKKRFSRLSNRGKVRQAYCDFLRRERSKGMKIKKHYTTEDVLRRISDTTDEEAAVRLRELYIAARYDDTREVTRQQADAARLAARKCIESRSRQAD